MIPIFLSSTRCARQQTYDLARLVAVPGAYYRTDIGEHCGENIRLMEELHLPLAITRHS